MEAIICATSVPQGTGSGCIALHDFQTGSSLATFKQTNAAEHCTSILQSRNGQGGFMLSAQPDKSILNVYNFQKDQLSLKIVLPEKLTCTALDARGDFFAAGTANGRIFLWEVASGILFNSWDAHYRRVNVVKFTSDGAALLSASEDTSVSVWSLSRLLDDELQADLMTPLFTLSDHTLPVTDIVCGVGAFPRCRALTSSQDHSAKLWDLSTKSLLATFQFPQPVSCIAWELSERSFFAGSANGDVHQVNLFRNRNQKAGSLEAIGGGGASDVIRVDEATQEIRRQRLISVRQPVTCLSFSLTSSSLLVGTSTGIIQIYDVASHQLLRSVNLHKGSSITYLASMLKPPDLIGHVSLSLNVSSTADAKDSIPVKPVVQFHRTKDPKMREAHDTSMILPGRIQNPSHGEENPLSDESFLRDHAFFVRPDAIGHQPHAGTDPVSLQGQVNELEAEVRLLKEQLTKAKGLNDTMWENVVQKVFNPKAQDREGEQQTSRKRSRAA